MKNLPLTPNPNSLFPDAVRLSFQRYYMPSVYLIIPLILVSSWTSFYTWLPTLRTMMHQNNPNH